MSIEHMNDETNDEIQRLINVFPEKIATVLEKKGRTDDLLEVVFDVGRFPTARYTTGDEILSDEEITPEDIARVTDNVGEFDLDNRAGMERALHRISAIRNRRGKIIGLTCRVGRAVFGTIDIIQDFLESGQNILILGKPGIGKTTMLREAARMLSQKKRVVIVDTSNEIGGDGDIPHPAIGNARRMQVAKPALQHEVMIEAVENHNPEVIVIDEIGRELEAAAARTIAERGVQLIGTAHGQTLGNLLMNPTLSDLIGGIESVTLSDEEAKRRGTQKTVLERRSPPTFDVLVEIKERNKVIVYRDVAEAVDSLVRGFELFPEMRRRLPDGKIVSEKAPSPVLDGIGASSPNTIANTDAGNGRRNENSRQRSNILQIMHEETNENPLAQNQRKIDTEDSPQNNGVSAVPAKPIRILGHGLSRSRMTEAAARLQVPVILVNDLDEADVMITLRPYYRERQSIIVDAEERNIPIFVLRSNTISQIEYSLGNLFKVQVQDQAVRWEDVEDETLSAIRSVLNGEVSWIDLSPANRSVRQIQQEMIEKSNLVFQPFGKEPRRRLRVYRNK